MKGPLRWELRAAMNPVKSASKGFLHNIKKSMNSLKKNLKSFPM
jgi:hypothetical protein